MELISPEEFTNEQLFKSSKLVAECIVPLFREDKKKNLEMLGSSVYLEVNGRYYLATASHVVNERPRIFGDPELDPGLSVDKFFGYRDPADVAICQLEQRLSKYKPLSISRARDLRSLPSGGRFFCIGFPDSKTKAFKQVIRSTVISIFTGGLCEVDFERLDVSPDYCFGLSYPTSGLKGEDGVQTNQVNAHGMSGGGVFWVHDRIHVELVEPFLVGILIRHDNKDWKTLVATRFEMVRTLLTT